LLTPFFIVCLFANFPYANTIALVIFIVASITDAYDGYYARKYDMVTPQGEFLDPLADKILVSSAFISFAIMGLVEYWMVVLILFRDLFVTGLRMAMKKKGFHLVTSNIAKAKTAAQIGIIIFILVIVGFKGIPIDWINPIIYFVQEMRIIYYFTLLVTIFTVLTGISYIYNNRSAIRKFLA